MEVFPTRAEFRKLAGDGNLVPVYTDLMGDFETPVSVYAKLKANGEPAFLLESIEGGAHLNRYSFIGFQPRKTMELHLGGEAIIRERGGEEVRFPCPTDPLTVLEEEMARYHPVRLPGMPRFMGGAVGYLAYEYIHAVEPTVPLAGRDVLKMPVAHFLITDKLVIFDRARQTIRLLVNAHIPEAGSVDLAYDRASADLAHLAESLRTGRSIPTIPVPAVKGGVEVPEGNFTRPQFESMVEACKEYIRAGDVIQVVGSQRFERPFTRSPLDLYRVLRTVNPSPYMVLLDTGPYALVGASPEVHVRLTDGLAEVRPIAGTRPRGGTLAEDQAYEKDLLADEKERAEHLMLVDLARNDLGRVCKYGSVQVPEYMIVERYSHVMHIVSQVEGRIDDPRNAYDLMRATFPAGTVSGAPKIRAMQIIAEQEREQRGPYAGAVCYFSYDGNLDSCIAIRTALLRDQRIHVQSGAGLVADSVPSSEYMETVNKATGMLKAIRMSEVGLG
ncbi:MAG: anthranilate synthase component I [Verrucomicrobia bacterium]|jgi:anthranilate synthase component 1|nr:anthranilate synthase component I [Verrucomicrobiota bacterium]